MMHPLFLLILLGVVGSQSGDPKSLFGQMGAYQLPTLATQDFRISFRTYVEYNNSAYMPLLFGFS